MSARGQVGDGGGGGGGGVKGIHSPEMSARGQVGDRWGGGSELKTSILRDVCKRTGGGRGGECPFSDFYKRKRKEGVNGTHLVTVALCVGVQILLRDYDFTSSSVFTDDDVIAMYPLVRHTNFRVGPLPTPRI